MSGALSETRGLHSGEEPGHWGAWPRPGRPPPPPDPVSRGAAFVFPEAGRGSPEVGHHSGACASSLPWRKRQVGQPRAVTQVSRGRTPQRVGRERLAFLAQEPRRCRAAGLPGRRSWGAPEGSRA